MANRYRDPFWGDGNTLELNSGKRLHSIVNIINTIELHTLK